MISFAYGARWQVPGVEHFHFALDIFHVLEERIDDRPRCDGRQKSRDHEYKPVLVKPRPPAVAGDPGFAAQAHLPLDQVTHMAAVRLFRGDADHISMRI